MNHPGRQATGGEADRQELDLQGLEQPHLHGGVRHKDVWFKAEHQPLVELSTWEAVQSVLQVSPRVRANYTRATIPFLLKGIVQGTDVRALTVSWTRKGTGRLYRYYMHTRENKEYAVVTGLPRLPTIDLEGNVIDKVRQILRAPDLKTRVAKAMHALDPSIDEAQLCVAMLQIDKIWDQLFPAELELIVLLLIKKVVVTPHTIEVQFRPNRIESLASEMMLKKYKAVIQEMAA